MIDLVSLSYVELAFALFHASAGTPGGRRRSVSVAGRRAALTRRLQRGAAFGFVLAAVLVWARSVGLVTASLLVATALMTIGSAFTLLAPVMPRVVWGATAACLPMSALLTVYGALRG